MRAFVLTLPWPSVFECVAGRGRPGSNGSGGHGLHAYTTGIPGTTGGCCRENQGGAPVSIYVKRVYEDPSPDDGFRVLVDRVWPRGMSKEHAKIDLWAKTAAPSTALRQWFAHDPAKWDEFRKRYRAELAGNPTPVEELRAVLRDKKKVTLVYGAKDEQHNQALVLREILLSDEASK